MKETYTISVACFNCDWSGLMTLEKGVEFKESSKLCQSCGCRTLTRRHEPKFDQPKEKYWMQSIDDNRMLCELKNYGKLKINGFEGSPTLPNVVYAHSHNGDTR